MTIPELAREVAEKIEYLIIVHSQKSEPFTDSLYAEDSMNNLTESIENLINEAIREAKNYD